MVLSHRTPTTFLEFLYLNLLASESSTPDHQLHFLVIFFPQTGMDPGSHIKSLLQFQLGSDNSTVRNLPYCLSTLTSECFVPSAHVAKWTSRVNSLMHAKDPSARWAGLCLAFKTSLLSQAIMIDCAQSWVVIALSALSVCIYILPPCLTLIAHL